jgi:hypothetical protein
MIYIVAVSSPVSTTPAINENQGAFAGVNDTGERLIAHVIDTSDQPSVANIFVNFQKQLKWPHCCS